MTKQSRLALLAIAALLVIGGVAGTTWYLQHRSDTAFPAASPSPNADQEAAHEAAAVAADLPAHRSSAIDPELTDDPNAVPVYPPNTQIILDQSSWVPIGEVASAYAHIMPQNEKVLIHFTRINGHWRIALIETQP